MYSPISTVYFFNVSRVNHRDYYNLLKDFSPIDRSGGAHTFTVKVMAYELFVYCQNQLPLSLTCDTVATCRELLFFGLLAILLLHFYYAHIFALIFYLKHFFLFFLTRDQDELF